MSDIIYLIMMMNASTLLYINHPLSYGLILLIQVIMTAMFCGLLSNFWYSYIFFLIMIGGILILFIYMTSIASNEKFKLNNKFMLTIMIMLSLLIMLILIDKFYINFLINTQEMSLINNQYNYKFSMNKYFNKNQNYLMMMMMIYLFITLIATVKITNYPYGTLRQKF
uniref:NADH-ubiquinone oxidoreductase chain 6 n=1 Tax=Hyphasis sp. REN-2018 TaxID=2506507 RepID=A0A411DA37_9CUCU|nr:NADH dehydrogenase subunit 6 [Hyphasis sp. REN-2018]